MTLNGVIALILRYITENETIKKPSTIKPINPSYFTIICANPGSATCYFLLL